MRKWGPAVFIVVALGLMLVWSQCDPPPQRAYTPTTEEALNVIAEEVLGELDFDMTWSATEKSSFDLGVLSKQAQDQLDLVTDPYPGFLEEVEKAIAGHKTGATVEGGFLDWTVVNLAAARAHLIAGDTKKAIEYLLTVSADTQFAVNTATSVAEWEQAQIARLRYFDIVAGLLSDSRWGADLDQAATSASNFANHRLPLGNIIRRRFVVEVIPVIARASESKEVSHEVVKALFSNPEGNEIELVAAILRGNERVFSPEMTASSGAESIRQLRTALDGPWSGAREVLDRATEARKFWTGFLDLLALDDDLAMTRVTELKQISDGTENPVGLALLYRERGSWSGLVQSAYVADARESAHQVLIAKLLGLTGLSIDPISGDKLEAVDGAVRFMGDAKNDAYPFIKALTEQPIPLAP